MKFTTLVVAMMVAFAALIAAPGAGRSADGAEGIQVLVTAYTCENHPRNPMYPCGPLRWGGDIYSENMACPVSWRGRVLDVPGYGTRTCDDTPREGYLQGLPHIDLRVSSYQEARRIGIRKMTIYPAGSLTPEAPVSTTLESAAVAIASAHEEAPTGDAETAMARLLSTRTATKHFPWLAPMLEVPADEPLWLISIWVPAADIQAGSQPFASGSPIASRFFVYDAVEGNLLVEGYVDRSAIETMGWISSESLNLQR